VVREMFCQQLFNLLSFFLLTIVLLKGSLIVGIQCPDLLKQVVQPEQQQQVQTL
jgi:hypothetical protein